uniref:costars family protein ABRACL n=1 Tax=Myxine glutinosa TaxID=7769 RepID=UPI00358ECB69
MNTAADVSLLMEEIKRLGKTEPDGRFCVTFGTLFADERCVQMFEALVGTLRAAKKQHLIDFPHEMLFQGVHDDVLIERLQS